jgi:hypothetical protein
VSLADVKRLLPDDCHPETSDARATARPASSPISSAAELGRSVTGGNGGEDDNTGLNASGRYVRINGTARGTAWGYSLFTFEVYGFLFYCRRTEARPGFCLGVRAVALSSAAHFGLARIWPAQSPGVAYGRGVAGPSGLATSRAWTVTQSSPRQVPGAARQTAARTLLDGPCGSRWPHRHGGLYRWPGSMYGDLGRSRGTGIA